MRHIAFAIILSTLASSCAATVPAPDTDPYHTQPPFGGQAKDLREAFARSCAKFAKKPAGSLLHSNPVFGTYGQWQGICKTGLALPATELEGYLNTRLTKVEKQAETAKFTGYYKPVIQGARKRGGPYQTPLLKLPKDFASCNGRTGQKQPDGSCTSPYLSREQIDANLDKYEPILWLKDPTDAYFLQIQGSGTVELAEGGIAHVGFAGKNGHPYVAIGKTMKQWGYLSGSITADKIRGWLSTASTASATEVYHSNPSYIFFREFPQESPGAFGIPLVPGRSLAVDKSFLPLGVPVFVDTHLTHDDKNWQRIMFAHDVGSAIVGKVRGDIFFGQGPASAERAGDQNASGRLYMMVPRENVNPTTVVQR